MNLQMLKRDIRLFLHCLLPAAALTVVFAAVCAAAAFLAVKGAEDGSGIIVRLSDVSGKGGEVTLDFCKAVKSAFETDLNENVTSELSADGSTVNATVEAYGIKTVLVKF